MKKKIESKTQHKVAVIASTVIHPCNPLFNKPNSKFSVPEV